MESRFSRRATVVLAGMALLGSLIERYAHETRLLDEALTAAQSAGFKVTRMDHPYCQGLRGYRLSGGNLSFEVAEALADCPQIYLVELRHRWMRDLQPEHAEVCLAGELTRSIVGRHGGRIYESWLRKTVCLDREDRLLEALRVRLISEGAYVQEWDTTRRGAIFRLRGVALGLETAEQLAAAQRVGAVIVELPTAPEIDELLNQHFRESFVTNANTPTARQRWNR